MRKPDLAKTEMHVETLSASSPPEALQWAQGAPLRLRARLRALCLRAAS